MGTGSIAPNEREQQAFASVSQRLLRPRTRSIGRYRIDAELGAGAMGTVFEGYDPALGRKVAIKLLRRERMRSKAARARFLQEARALAAVSHPHVVTVYEIGEHERDLFIAMELVEARTLEEWLAEDHPGWPAIIDAFMQLGSGLRAVHDGGVTHRDLKPSNILVADDGRVRVVDFGLALLASDPSISMSIPPPTDSGISSRLTDPGQLLGTPAYMAPEQHVGAPATPAADQFSFCVTLWEALYGTRPFDVDTVEEFLCAARTETRTTKSRPKGLPRTVETVLARGLRLEPEQRWPSMAVLMSRLDRATSPRRSPLLMIAAAVVASAGGFVTLAGTTDEDACARLHQRATNTWNDAARERIGVAFEGAGRTDALPRVRDMLDAYSDRWTVRFDEACGDEGPRDAAVACLDAKIAAMGAAIELLSKGVPTTVDRAPEVVSRLPDVGSCARSTAGPPPEEAFAIWPVIARADALRHAGDLEASAEAASTAAAQALEVGYLPLVAEARLAEGRARGQQFDLDAAATQLEAAYLLAVDAGDDRLAMDAALELFEHMMNDDGDHAAALQWWRHAEAAARRLGHEAMPPDQRVGYGILLHATGRAEEAQLVFEQTREQTRRALELLEPTGMGPERIELLAALGKVEVRLRDYEAALQDMGAAVGVASAVFGPESYTHALLSFELGSIAVTRGDYDIAIEQLQHAYAVLDRVAPGQRRANLAQVKLGWCLAQVGRYDEAIPMLEAAHTAQTNLLRPEHADVLYAALTLAEVRLGAGQTDGVEELLERSLVSARALRGPNSSIAGAMLVRLGMLAERRDDARLAERRYREALEILRPDPTMPPSYLEVLALLAQLVVQHREYPEALSLTEEMVRVGKRRYGDDATATLRIELIAARVYNDSGRGLEFVDRIARVQELLAEREVDPVFVARAQFEHAQALHASDARRAMQLARDAHATLVTRTGGANDAEAVAAWLAAHRRRN